MGQIEKRKKLYVIGVDSTPLWIITQLYKKYRMKGFEEFIKHGFLKEMKSTLPPVSGPAWVSIYSGMEPKDHGVIDFLSIDRNYTRQLIYYDPKKHKPFWDLLAEEGIGSLVVTPPMVLQKSGSKKVDIITGWPLSSKYSSKRLESVAKRFGFEGEPDIGVDLENRKMSVEEASKRYVDGMNARAEMCKHLIKSGNYDLVFVCFTETDRIYHYVFSKKDWATQIAPLYKAASDFVEWVIEYTKTRDENSVVMLLSDHGAQPVRNKFLLNTFLVNKGYVKLRTDISDETGDESSLSMKARRYLSERVMKFRMRRIVYDRMPAFMKKFAERVVFEGFGEQHESYKKIYETDFDMPRTKAFAAVSYGPVGMIWINDKRFARPGVREAERSRIKSGIMEELRKLRTEKGERLVSNVFDGARYFSGRQNFIVPDIMLELRDGYIIDFSYYSKRSVFMKPEFGRSGDHTRFGIFGLISNDKDFDLGRIGKKEFAVEDVCPMILSYFGFSKKL